MRKLNLPLVLDTLFAGVCAFLLFFTLIRFYTRSAVWGLVAGLCACALAGAAGFFYISGKQEKKQLISGNEKTKKLLSLHLSLSSDDDNLNLFQKCFGEEAEINGKNILTDKTLNFFNFKMQPITEDDIARIIKHKFDGEKAVYCIKISPEAAILAENFCIKVTEINSIFHLLKEKELLPEKYIYEEPPKTKIFKKIKSRFNRKICAPLFWSGLSLLALSYFTFFPIYYIISGGIMLILSAVALVINQS